MKQRIYKAAFLIALIGITGTAGSLTIDAIAWTDGLWQMVCFVVMLCVAGMLISLEDRRAEGMILKEDDMTIDTAVRIIRRAPGKSDPRRIEAENVIIDAIKEGYTLCWGGDWRAVEGVRVKNGQIEVTP